MYESISKNNELENEMTLDMSYFWYSDETSSITPQYHIAFDNLSPLSMQLQQKNNHLSIGRCQVLKIQCILLLRFQNLCFHNISTKMLQITLKVQEPG